MKVKRTADLFLKKDVAFNILTVVNKAVAKHPRKIYNHFKKAGYRYLQFIPCLDDIGSDKGQQAHSLTAADYGDFLCRLFDLWYEDFMKQDYVSIRYFDNLVQMLLGYPPESCDMMGRCSVNLVIESDGSAYPCDFYVLDEWRLGNIVEESFQELADMKIGHDFVQVSLNQEDECKDCPYFALCRGGCRRHREKWDGTLGINDFCDSYKQFYKYALPRLQQVSKLVARNRR